MLDMGYPSQQLQTLVDVRKEWLEHLGDDPDFMKRIITRDEIWVYHFDPLSSQALSAWKNTRMHLMARKSDKQNQLAKFF